MATATSKACLRGPVYESRQGPVCKSIATATTTDSQVAERQQARGAELPAMRSHLLAVMLDEASLLMKLPAGCALAVLHPQGLILSLMLSWHANTY